MFRHLQKTVPGSRLKPMLQSSLSLLLLACGIAVLLAGISVRDYHDKSPDAYIRIGENLSISDPNGQFISDCSGITYYPKNDTFFIVENDQKRTFEIDRSGKVLVTRKVKDLRDPEGIAYDPIRDVFWFADEHSRVLVAYRLEAEAWVHVKEIKTGLPAPKKNTGLEGVTFCRSRNSLFCVNEGKPKQWMEFDLSEGNFGKLKQSVKVRGVKDLSGVAFDEAGGRLLILSELSHVVLFIDPETGVIEDQLRVEAPEPEGITIGEKGLIYICGEPNELMVFEPADSLTQD